MDKIETIGLLDIAPADIAPETVKVSGKAVAVYGVSAEGIVALFKRFPLIEKIMTGQKPKNLKPETLMEMIPDAIAAIIAAGTGYPGDKNAEKVAAKMSADIQVEFLEKTIRLTMPKGVGPFMERLQSLGLLMTVEDGVKTAAVTGTEPGTKSPKP